MPETTDEFSSYPAHRSRGRRATDRPKVNWSAVAVLVTLALWLLGAASGLFGDYRRIGDRVTTLETQRIEDLRRDEATRQDQVKRLERLEDKVDRVLERVK